MAQEASEAQARADAADRELAAASSERMALLDELHVAEAETVQLRATAQLSLTSAESAEAEVQALQVQLAEAEAEAREKAAALEAAAAVPPSPSIAAKAKALEAAEAKVTNGLKEPCFSKHWQEEGNEKGQRKGQVVFRVLAPLTGDAVSFPFPACSGSARHRLKPWRWRHQKLRLGQTPQTGSSRPPRLSAWLFLTSSMWQRPRAVS